MWLCQGGRGFHFSNVGCSLFNWLCIFREEIALMFCGCIDILVILSSDGGATSGQLDHHVLDYLFCLVPYNLVNGTAFLET